MLMKEYDECVMIENMDGGDRWNVDWMGQSSWSNDRYDDETRQCI